MSVVEFDNRKLKEKVKDVYGTIAVFAEKIGLSQRQLERKFCNVSCFTREEIITWAKMLNISDEEIHRYFFVVKS